MHQSSSIAHTAYVEKMIERLLTNFLSMYGNAAIASTSFQSLMHNNNVNYVNNFK